MRDKEEINSHLIDYCLNTFDQREHHEGWMAWYIGYRVHRLAEWIQERVSSRSSKTILTNTSHQILAGILQHQESHDFHILKDKYLLLEHIHKQLCQKGQVDVLQSHYVIFMVTKIHGDVPGEVLRHLETQHGEVILRALRSKANGLSSRLSMVEHLEPNMLSDREVQ
jgi:hypothetical protein